jgi:uncharacterized protein (TIGR02391 family)
MRTEDIQDPADLDFWPLIHPAVREIAEPRFRSGHYADSVSNSLIKIEETVREVFKNRRGEERSGRDLMMQAFKFSVDNPPVIKLDDLATRSGRDRQEGYQFLFAGAMSGIRNPKSHSVLAISPENAVHLIFLASTLMHALDGTWRLPRSAPA